MCLTAVDYTIACHGLNSVYHIVHRCIVVNQRMHSTSSYYYYIILGNKNS